MAFEPLNRFTKQEEAKKWIDAVVSYYFKKNGISMSVSGNSAGLTGQTVAVVSSAELNAFRKEYKQKLMHELELLAAYSGVDLNEARKLVDQHALELETVQKELELWQNEHGQFYGDSIKSQFNALKVRRFDSYWNWVRQDVTELFYEIVYGRLKEVDRQVINRCLAVINRGHEELLDYMEYKIKRDPKVVNGTGGYQLVRQFAEILMQSIREGLDKPPVYKDVSIPRAPKTVISETGQIVYSEVCRENIRKLFTYVQEMKAGSMFLTPPIRTHALNDIFKLYRIVRSKRFQGSKGRRKVKTLINQIGESLLIPTNALRLKKGLYEKKILTPCQKQTSYSKNLPYLSIKKKNSGDPSIWEHNQKATAK